MTADDQRPAKLPPIQVRERLRAAKVAKFVKLVTGGSTYTDAFLQVTPGCEFSDKQEIYDRASKFARHPLVQSRLIEAARIASVQQLDSHGLYHLDVRRWCEAAEAASNWTGLAALGRLRGQSGTFIRENISIEHDHSSAVAVLDRLAKLAPGMAEQLRPLLGHDGFGPVIDSIPDTTRSVHVAGVKPQDNEVN